MTTTDDITLLLSIFFIFRGSSRGFIRSLLAPFSIIVATILSILYYQITKDMVLSLLIGLFGPMLLSFLLGMLLKSWAVATNTDIKPNFLSRLGGAFLTLVWGWVFIAFTLILLALLPPWGRGLTMLRNDVTRSISYSIVLPFKESIFPSPSKNVANITTATTVTNAKSLADDPRFQKVLQDPDIQNEIAAHDFARLMSNPKMMELTKEIMNDPATMKKVLAVYSSQKQPLTTTSSSE